MTDRPATGVYHITVSLNGALGVKPNDSNAMLMDESQWENIDPFYVEVEPAFFPFGG